jgi:hypothetical protein
MSSDFFRTRMGQTFYEATMPSLVRELARRTRTSSGSSPSPRSERRSWPSP